jgi:hypothetical protein
MAAQEFRVREESQRDQLIAIGSSLFFLAVMAGVLWARPQFRSLSGCAVAAAVSIFLVWTVVRELQTIFSHKSWPIVIDEQGVRYASPGRIAWAETSGLEPVGTRQRVDLRDAQGRVRVSLPYYLEDAHEVFQFVADMLADRWPQMPLPHDFVRKLPKPLLAAGAALIVALGGAIYSMRGHATSQLFFVLAMALVVSAFASRWLGSVRRLTIGKDELTVAKGMRPRVLSYADIEAVGLFVVGSEARRHLDVKVTFRDRSAMYVLPAGCDPFDGYAIVKASWESGRSSTASATPIAAG